MSKIKKERLKNYRMTSQNVGRVRMPDGSLVKEAYGLCPGNLYTLPANVEGGVKAFARTDAACDELIADTYILNGFNCNSNKLINGAPNFKRLGNDKYSIQVVETVPRSMEKTAWDKLSLNGRVANVANACGIARNQRVNYSVDIGKDGKRVENYGSEKMFVNGYLYRPLGTKGIEDLITVNSGSNIKALAPVDRKEVVPVKSSIDWTQGSRAGYTCDNCK